MAARFDVGTALRLTLIPLTLRILPLRLQSLRRTAYKISILRTDSENRHSDQPSEMGGSVYQKLQYVRTVIILVLKT